MPICPNDWIAGVDCNHPQHHNNWNANQEEQDVDDIVEEIAWRDRIDYTEVISVTNVVHDDHENACSEDELEYETASDEDDDSDECDDGDDGDNNTDMNDSIKLINSCITCILYQIVNHSVTCRMNPFIMN